MSDYNAIFRTGNAKWFAFPSVFYMFCSAHSCTDAWDAQSLFCLWGGNACTSVFSAHDCHCAHSALSACAPTSAISSCWGWSCNPCPSSWEWVMCLQLFWDKSKNTAHVWKGYQRSLKLNWLTHPKMLTNQSNNTVLPGCYTSFSILKYPFLFPGWFFFFFRC